MATHFANDDGQQASQDIENQSRANLCQSPPKSDVSSWGGVAETMERMLGPMLGDITNVAVGVLGESPLKSPVRQRSHLSSSSPGNGSVGSPFPRSPVMQRSPMLLGGGQCQSLQPQRVDRWELFERAASAVREALSSGGMDSEWTSRLATRVVALTGSQASASGGTELYNIFCDHGWSGGQFGGPPDRELLLRDLLWQQARPEPTTMSNDGRPVPTPMQRSHPMMSRDGRPVPTPMQRLSRPQEKQMQQKPLPSTPENNSSSCSNNGSANIQLRQQQQTQQQQQQQHAAPLQHKQEQQAPQPQPQPEQEQQPPQATGRRRQRCGGA